MLRITLVDLEAGQRWTLCGQLTGPWVAELRACWECGRKAGGGVHTVVDLTDVTSVDQSGENLLSEMRQNGTEFVGAGVYTRYLLENLNV